MSSLPRAARRRALLGYESCCCGSANVPPPIRGWPVGSSRREIIRDLYSCGFEVATTRHLRRGGGFEEEFVPDTENLLARLDHACGVKVLADLVEHVAALGIDRVHGEGV